MSTLCKIKECDQPAVDLGYCKSCLAALGTKSRSSVTTVVIETDSGNDDAPDSGLISPTEVKPDGDKRFRVLVSAFILQIIIMGVIALKFTGHSHYALDDIGYNEDNIRGLQSAVEDLESEVDGLRSDVRSLEYKLRIK